MKKLFTSLILLMAGVMATYAENYGLYVCGTQVTSSNASNIKPGVQYNAASKKLTLTNANLDGGNSVVIKNENIEDLKISIIGTCTLKANTDVLIFKKKTLIDGVYGTCGTLKLETTKSSGATIWVQDGSELNIYNLWLTAKGINYSIYADGNEKVWLSCCVLNATVTSGTNGAFTGFASASFDGGDAYLTTGAYNSSQKAVCESSSSSTRLMTVETTGSLIVGSDIVRVGTSSNVTPVEMTAGSAVYDDPTKTLTLNGAKISTTKNNIVRNNKIDGLKIKLVGANELKGATGSCIRTEKNMTIEGDGHLLLGNASLSIENVWSGIAFSGGSTLTFNNATVVVDANGFGISGGNGLSYTTETAVVKNSLIAARGKGSIAFGNFKTLTLEGSCLNTGLSAEGVCWRQALGGFGTATELYKGEDVVVLAVPTETYDVSVLGEQLNDANCYKFVTDGMTAGIIGYDNSSKKLTLNNVTLAAPEGVGDVGIESKNHAVETITLTGDNAVTTKGTAFDLYGDVTIEGDGSLTATSTEESGISMTQYGSSCTLTLNVNNKVKFLGATRGIWGHSGYTSDLVLKKAGDNSDYYFKGTSYGAVYEVSDLKLTDMDFWSGSDGTPGCYFDGGYVRQNGGATVKGDNVVNFYQLGSSDRYGIKVGGVEVTYCNRQGVGSKYITAGGGTAVTYDNTSKTLTLNGATINTDGGSNINCIRNVSVDGLTINVASVSRLESRVDSWGGFYTNKNTTITGAGKLTVDYINDPSYCFSVSGGSLTLKDINMSIAGDLKGYTSAGDNYLYIDLAAGKRVEVAGSVYDFTDITFRNGSKLLEPEGAWYDNTNKYVTTGSGKATGIVFADKDATGIMGIEMDQNAEVESIFDAQGRQVDELQQGVNIIRMSDGTTRKVIKK